MSDQRRALPDANGHVVFRCDHSTTFERLKQAREIVHALIGADSSWNLVDHLDPGKVVTVLRPTCIWVDVMCARVLVDVKGGPVYFILANERTEISSVGPKITSFCFFLRSVAQEHDVVLVDHELCKIVRLGDYVYETWFSHGSFDIFPADMPE